MKKLLDSVVSMVAFVVAALLIWGLSSGLAQGQQPSQGNKLAHAAQHKNMQLVGTNDLQSRSTYQPTVHKQGGKYILYAGHHPLGTNPVTGQPLPSFNPLTKANEPNGTSLVDVTDPAHPEYLAHIPVGTTGNGGAQMVRVCDGSTLPNTQAADKSKVFMLRSYSNSAHEIWDTTDPSHPVGVRTVAGGNPVIGSLTGTHKNWWECDTGIAWLVGRRSTDTAWRPGNHIIVFNLSDPRNPVFIRDWALDGQQPGAPIPTTAATDYKTAEVGRFVMNPINGAHTSFPVGTFTIPDWVKNEEGVERDFVVVVSEETDNQCTGPRHLVYMVDVTEFTITTAGATTPVGTIVSHPQGQANYQVFDAAGDFCDRGGRFGPHATHEEFGPLFYQKIVFVSYFNAGLRAIDVRDPFNPQEVAFYIPATTDNTDFRCATINGQQSCKQAIQTNNVATDDRGYIYIVDRADTGLHVLQLTGPGLDPLK